MDSSNLSFFNDNSCDSEFSEIVSLYEYERKSLMFGFRYYRTIDSAFRRTLHKSEIKALSHKLHTNNFLILYIFKKKNSKVFTVSLYSLDDLEFPFDVVSVELNNPEFDYIYSRHEIPYWKYTFKRALTGELYEKYLKNQIQDKNNHWRPAQVGYHNGFGDVLKKIEYVRVPGDQYVSHVRISYDKFI